MKDLIKNIFSKIKDTGVFKIDTTYLKDNSWFYVSEDVLRNKIVYIFRNNGELLISKDGDITKATWENLVHSTNSLILEINGKTSLFNIIYLTSEYLVIQKDGTDEVKVFIKQQRYSSKLPKDLDNNPIDFIFKDLNTLLNDNNSKNFSSIEIEQYSERPTIIHKQSSLKENNFQVEKVPYNFEDQINLNIKSKSEFNVNQDFEYFDLLFYLEKIREQNNGLTNQEEVDLIIELQEKEEELIETNKVCKYCKAIDSIKGNTCTACNKEISEPN